VFKHRSKRPFISICCLIFFNTLTNFNLFAVRFPRKESLPYKKESPVVKAFSLVPDENGVVVNTKLLKFNEDLDNTYNPSIIERENKYLLIFRHDSSKKWCERCKLKQAQIKMVYLDKNFDQITPTKTIEPNISVAEDARLHCMKGQLYLTFNDEFKGHFHPWKRQMCYAKFDAEQGCMSDVKEVPSGDISVTPIEKNWMPFEYPENGGSLHYIYSVAPYKVIKVDDAGRSLSFHHCSIVSKDINLVWDRDMWGVIRGGTPARLVDDVYITFFHSMKFHIQKKCYYYLMGAYVFQAQPPFKILAMTPKPIVFDGMYSARRRIKILYALYPGGFAIEKKDGKTLLHVACGENDTSVRIVTIDKDALLKSMVTLP